MDKDKFLEIELNEQVAYLNGLCAEGKGVDDITAELGIDKRELQALGLYFVKDKFMGKPMRGYQTAKRSGNETSKFDGAKVIERGKGSDL
jgi:hypothetical protein